LKRKFERKTVSRRHENQNKEKEQTQEMEFMYGSHVVLLEKTSCLTLVDVDDRRKGMTAYKCTIKTRLVPEMLQKLSYT
jgi:hypothetical protein